MPNLSTLIPAVLGLLGTLVVAFLGYRQWKRQHSLTRAGSVLVDKQAAYKSIWGKLETVHLYVRSETFQKDRYLELVREVNVEMMHSGLLLERGEKGLVNEYLQALRVLAETIDHQEDESLRNEVQDTLYTTAPIPDEVMQKAADLRAAYEGVEEKREMLIQRFRKAIGADAV
jgi:hypothetical protein